MVRTSLALLLLGAVSVSSAVVVDNFGGAPTSVSTEFSVPQDYDSSLYALVPGGTRYLGQNFTGGDKRAAAGIANGTFNVSTPFGAETITALSYGNITTPITGGNIPNWSVDLSGTNYDFGGGNLLLNFIGNEQPLAVRAFLLSENGLTIYEKTVAGNQFSPFSVELTAADLTSSSLTSLSSFDTLYVSFHSSNSGDFELGSIETVPEPASIAALACGLVAVLRRRNRK